MALLPVLPHSGGDLLPHSDEVLHGVEGQFDIIPLQAHQVIWLRMKRLSQVQEKKDFTGERKYRQNDSKVNVFVRMATPKFLVQPYVALLCH